MGAGAWAVTAFLPLPALTLTDPANGADLACLYLGLGNALLAAEFHRFWGPPRSVGAWRVRTSAATATILADAALFVEFGYAAGVRTTLGAPS